MRTSPLVQPISGCGGKESSNNSSLRLGLVQLFFLARLRKPPKPNSKLAIRVLRSYPLEIGDVLILVK